MLEVKTKNLELIEKYENYHLARYKGKLGIWSIFKNDAHAVLLDDDCDHLLNPESEGLFTHRVLLLKEEARFLMSEFLDERPITKG